jgi:prolyl-tRNA synthetase
VRLEVGPRDIESKQVVLYRRDKTPRDKLFLSMQEAVNTMGSILDDIQRAYFEQARSFRDSHVNRDICDFGEFKRFFTPRDEQRPEIHGGFVLGKWSGAPEALETLKELKVTVRCLPLEQSETEGRCVVTGASAVKDAIFAKAY